MISYPEEINDHLAAVAALLKSRSPRWDDITDHLWRLLSIVRYLERDDRELSKERSLSRRLSKAKRKKRPGARGKRPARS